MWDVEWKWNCNWWIKCWLYFLTFVARYWIFFIYLLGHQTRASDSKTVNKQGGAVLGTAVKHLELVINKIMLQKLLDIMNKTAHPLNITMIEWCHVFSKRLFYLHFKNTAIFQSNKYTYFLLLEIMISNCYWIFMVSVHLDLKTRCEIPLCYYYIITLYICISLHLLTVLFDFNFQPYISVFISSKIMYIYIQRKTLIFLLFNSIQFSLFI